MQVPKIIGSKFINVLSKHVLHLDKCYRQHAAGCHNNAALLFAVLYIDIVCVEKISLSICLLCLLPLWPQIASSTEPQFLVWTKEK